MKITVVLSLSALALAAPTPQPANEGITVPVSRDRHASITRADGTVDVDHWLAHLKYTLLKYNPQMQLGERLLNADLRLKKRASNVPLIDFTQGNADTLYYGSGDVSGQTFKFDFDTGSSDTFVPGQQCGTSQGCDGAIKYDQSGTNRGTSTTVRYGSGQVTGSNFLDTVTVGGLAAQNQNIISLTQAQGFSGTGSDSLMGMGFQSIANSKSSPYWYTLIQQGKCAAKEFSFYLGRQKSGTQGASSMTLCGRDTSKYTGALTAIPLSNQSYWQVKIDGAQVGSGLLSLPMPGSTGGDAAIDTGTTLIIAPTAAASSIFAQVPGSIPVPLGVGVPPILGFAYPCNSAPKVSLVFGGKPFAINDLDFNFGTLNQTLGLPLPLLGSSYCIAGIAGADVSPVTQLWVVGDSFLKNWYSVYHYDSPTSASVSFAAAKGNQ